MKPESDTALTTELHNRGMRATPERLAIYGVLESRGSRPMTARQIAEAVAETGLNIKRATVYNTLGTFMEIGIVRRKMITPSGTGSPVGGYVLAGPETGVQRQKLTVELALTCRVCGRVKVARDSELSNYVRRHRFTGFDTAGGTADIQISCICNRCLRAAAERGKPSQQK
ncbi:MAG: transcriptional repressor [Muribaculaceae bacterium]|nr:transcriptional repressor [Muribaculaceae bacterium]